MKNLQKVENKAIVNEESTKKYTLTMEADFSYAINLIADLESKLSRLDDSKLQVFTKIFELSFSSGDRFFEARSVQSNDSSTGARKLQ